MNSWGNGCQRTAGSVPLGLNVITYETTLLYRACPFSRQISLNRNHSMPGHKWHGGAGDRRGLDLCHLEVTSLLFDDTWIYQPSIAVTLSFTGEGGCILILQNFFIYGPCCVYTARPLHATGGYLLQFKRRDQNI